MPSFSTVGHVLLLHASADIRPYLEAYSAGLDTAFLTCGLIGVLGGTVALLAFGGADPLRTRWEYRNERTSDGVG